MTSAIKRNRNAQENVRLANAVKSADGLVTMPFERDVALPSPVERMWHLHHHHTPSQAVSRHNRHSGLCHWDQHRRLLVWHRVQGQCLGRMRMVDRRRGHKVLRLRLIPNSLQDLHFLQARHRQISSRAIPRRRLHQQGLQILNKPSLPRRPFNPDSVPLLDLSRLGCQILANFPPTPFWPRSFPA